MQLGGEVTSDQEVVRAVLARFGMNETNPIQVEKVSEIVTSLAKLASDGNQLFDVGTLVRVISSLVSPLVFQ